MPPYCKECGISAPEHVDPSQSNLAEMTTLPDDVLVELFKIYAESDTPLRLIRVCRRWHAIAAGVSSLWADILFYNGPKYDKIEPDWMFDIDPSKKLICYSPSSLASSIARVKGNKFELAIVRSQNHKLSTEEEWKVLQPSWFSQKCRALRLCARDSQPLVSHLTDLSALEELEIYGSVSNSDQASIASLLGTAARTSKLLRYLRTPNIPSLLDHPSLLGRVAMLHIQLGTTSNAAEITKYVTSATTLTIESSAYWIRPSLECPSPLLDTLVLIGLHWKSLSLSICSKLKHLTIKTGLQSTQTLELPNLTHLTVLEWWMAMLGLQAPKLQILELKEHYNVNCWDLGTLGEADLRPIKLDLDLSVPENTMEPLIRKLWGNIEELQIVYKVTDGSLWHPLASSLRGRGESASLCPNLKKLVILSAKRSTEMQKKSEDLLRGVKDAFNQVGKSIEVKYGWYEPTVMMEDHDPRDKPIWWTTFTD